MKNNFKIFAVTAVFGTILMGPALYASEMETHTVVPGDTLWDISQERLEDPFRWPALWKANPQISNPDLIYPDQELRLPGVGPGPSPAPASGADVESSEHREAAETDRTTRESPSPDVEPREEVSDLIPERSVPAPATPSPIIPVEEEKPTFSYHSRSGIITNNIPSDGLITGAPGEARVLGTGDSVFVQTAAAEPGQRFGVYRDLGRVLHPETRVVLGHLIDDVGVIEVTDTTDQGYRASIISTFKEVMPGDLIGPEPPAPLSLNPTSAPAGFTATVVAVNEMRTVAGAGDVVYLDAGSDAGLEPGQRLAFSENSSRDLSGTAIVVRVTPNTSAVIIEQSSREVEAGSMVSSTL